MCTVTEASSLSVCDTQISRVQFTKLRFRLSSAGSAAVAQLHNLQSHKDVWKTGSTRRSCQKIEQRFVEHFLASARRTKMTWENVAWKRESGFFFVAVKVRCAFECWKEACRASIITREKEDKAEVHHDGKLLLKYLRRWKEYTAVKLRKQVTPQMSITFQCLCWLQLKFYFSCLSLCFFFQLLTRQCMWFHNTRITAKSFYQWKIALQEHRNVTQKTSVALWHWSLTLERKVRIVCCYRKPPWWRILSRKEISQ